MVRKSTPLAYFRKIGFKGKDTAHLSDLFKKVGKKADLTQEDWENLNPARTQVMELKWLWKYETLKEYRVRHPDSWPTAREQFPDGCNLGLWLDRQQLWQEREKLDKQHEALLNKLGNWRRQDPWFRHFETLKKFRKRNPKRWPAVREEFPEGNKLGVWCHIQRQQRKKGRLEGAKTKLLEDLGFPWGRDDFWELKLGEVRKFVQSNGNSWPDKNGKKPKERTLATWLLRQRYLHQAGELSPTKAKQLKKIKYPLK